MENNSNNMNTAESLQIIQEMISAVKKDLSKDSFYFLLWGWLVFVASISHYTLLHMGFEYPFVVWFLMPIGGIVSGFYGRKESKKIEATTYVNEFMKYIVWSFCISLFIVLIFMSKLGLSTYPMIMILYGILLFVSGGVLRFKPLIIGGCINWASAIASFYVYFDMQLLLLGSAVLLGYIIPGYMLKKLETNN